MSYIFNIKNVSNKNFNKGISFIGDKIIRFDNSIEDKANLLSISRAYAKVLLEREVNVKYSTEGDDSSFTDGKEITISSIIEEESLDSTIGLVLHEASHIAITDFSILKKYDSVLIANGIDKKYKKLLHTIFNWLEDRRIDNWAYNKAIGYSKYYEALYYRYFLPEKTDKVIKELQNSNPKPTIQNYMFFIINSINDTVRMDELPDLDKIKNIINLDNLESLYSCDVVLEKSIEILKLILKNATEEAEENEEDNGDNQGESDSSDEKSDSNGESKGESSDKNEGGESSSENAEDESEGSETLSDKIGKILQDYYEINNHDSSDGSGNGKSSISKSEMTEIESKIEDLISEMEKFNEEIEDDNTEVNDKTEVSEYRIPFNRMDGKIKIYEKISTNFILSENYFFTKKPKKNITPSYDEGVIKGKRLKERLKQREEIRNVEQTQLKRGVIHDRSLYSAKFSKGRLFHKKIVDKYPKKVIHISVDASESMREHWENTIELLTTLAYGVIGLDNIDLQIVFRLSSYYEISGYVFYDSKYDNKSKLKYLKNTHPNGGTPEGLIYYAQNFKYFKNYINSNTIFINISDGAPNGNVIALTTNIIKDYIKKGVEIVSFFIGEETNSTIFKGMYGAKNSIIGSNKDLNKISKILNEKLMKK